MPRAAANRVKFFLKGDPGGGTIGKDVTNPNEIRLPYVLEWTALGKEAADGAGNNF